jgi:stalled ribosome rescue protein Dom34
MLAADPARAFYGPGHVRAAAELGAVGTLLLSDSLLRVNDVAQARGRAVWRAGLLHCAMQRPACVDLRSLACVAL